MIFQHVQNVFHRPILILTKFASNARRDVVPVLSITEMLSVHYAKVDMF